MYLTLGKLAFKYYQCAIFFIILYIYISLLLCHTRNAPEVFGYLILLDLPDKGVGENLKKNHRILFQHVHNDM